MERRGRGFPTVATSPSREGGRLGAGEHLESTGLQVQLRSTGTTAAPAGQTPSLLSPTPQTTAEAAEPKRSQARQTTLPVIPAGRAAFLLPF